MKMEQIIQNIKKYGKIAGEKGYTPGFSGNMSARCSNEFVITSSGSANGYLEDEDFSVIDIEGNFVRGNERPSSERFLHIAFYKQRSDINYIIHVHSPYLTAFSSSGNSIPVEVSPEIMYTFGDIPMSKYAIPGSDNLVKNTEKYFNNHDIVLLENHGVIVGGKTIKDAYLKLELAEEYAKTLVCAKILGGAKILPEDEVKKIYLLRQK